MALNIVSSGGDFDPYIKYNAKSGRWYLKDDVEVQNPVFVADFANIKTGWLWFAAGAAPDKVWDTSLTQPAAKPSEAHKRGFGLRLFSNTSFGGVVDLSGASMHLNSAVNDLYSAYEAAPEAKQGLLPVVKFTGSTPMKDKLGTNYKPNFAIEKWVPRPAEFDAVTEKAASSPAPAATSASVSEF
jgi:hypothetical protein